MDAKAMVGQRLRAYRIERELSQEEMGKLLGISAPAVFYIEKGQNVTLGRAAQIAALLGRTLDELLKEEPEHAA